MKRRTFHRLTTPIARPQRPSDGDDIGVDDEDDFSAVGSIAGWATRYNQLTGWRAGVDSYKLRLKPGCFGDSLKSNLGDMRCLAHHDTSQVLARLSAGDMRLTDSPNGLYLSVDLPPTTLGRDIWTLSNRADLDSFSVGFQDTDSEWVVETDPLTKAKTTILQVNKADLSEISVVVCPAIPGALYDVQPKSSAMPLSAARKPTATITDADRLRQTIAIVTANDANRLRESIAATASK